MADTKKIEYRTKSGERLWQTRTGDTAKYWELVEVWANENRVGHILHKRDSMFDPRPPSQEIRDRYEADMFLHQADRKEMLEYLKSVKIWREECQTVLTMFKNTNETDIWNYLEGVHLDVNTASKENIREIRKLLRHQYSGYTIIKGEENFNRLKDIPKFTSCALITSGLKELNLLFKQRASWKEKKEDFTDRVKVKYLRDFMDDWDKLANCLDRVDADDDTFVGCQKRLQDRCLDLSNKELLEKTREERERKTAAKYVTKTKEMAAMSANYTREVKAVDNGSRSNGQQYCQDDDNYQMHTSEQDYNNHYEQGYMMAVADMERRILKCLNCGSEKHMVAHCPVLACIGCKKRWPSLQDSRYHNALRCPSNPVKLPVKMFPSTGRAMHGRGFDTRGRGSGSYTSRSGM